MTRALAHVGQIRRRKIQNTRHPVLRRGRVFFCVSTLNCWRRAMISRLRLQREQKKEVKKTRNPRKIRSQSGIYDIGRHDFVCINILNSLSYRLSATHEAQGNSFKNQVLMALSEIWLPWQTIMIEGQRSFSRRLSEHCHTTKQVELLFTSKRKGKKS